MSEFSYVVDTGLVWPIARNKRKVTDHIQIHHTVGKYGTPARWAALHQGRISEGQRGVPYSYLILQDGTVYLGRGHEYGHGGVKDNITNNANQRSVAIAFDGDMRADGLPQKSSLRQRSYLSRTCWPFINCPSLLYWGITKFLYMRTASLPARPTLPFARASTWRPSGGRWLPQPRRSPSRGPNSLPYSPSPRCTHMRVTAV